MSKVAIVDDDAFELSVHVDSLREAGIEVEFFDSAKAALETIGRASYGCDLVIVDIMMPTEDVFSSMETENGKLTGVRLLEKLIAMRKSDIRIAVLTVRKDQKLLNLIARLPVMGIIHKPCMPDDFVEQVEVFLKAQAKEI